MIRCFRIAASIGLVTSLDCYVGPARCLAQASPAAEGSTAISQTAEATSEASSSEVAVDPSRLPPQPDPIDASEGRDSDSFVQAEASSQAVVATPADRTREKAPTTRKEIAEEEARALAMNSARALSLAFRSASRKALPSVVMIKTATAESSNSVRDVINRTFDGVGSGVIVSSDGLVLTNHHVIADANRIQVQLEDGRLFAVTKTTSDPNSDIAILQIPGKDLPQAELGDSDGLFVGDWVLAIGSPFTLESSVSAGIISGTNRWHTLSQTVSGQFLQTDAAINPGNSGGALVDLDGKIIGINTAISSRSGGFQGIGFAIPIRRAKWIMNELLENGRVRRGYAGIRFGDVPYNVAQDLELGEDSGAYAVDVVAGYPGDKAGLKPGDIVLKFGGRTVRSRSEVAETIQQSEIGQPISMTVLRGGEELELTIELEERN